MFVAGTMSLPMGMLFLTFMLMLTQVSAFVAVSNKRIPSTSSALLAQLDDDIAAQVQRAKDLLARSKAKVEKVEEEAEVATAVPFFASQEANKLNQIVKSRNEETGLVRADGEMMAKLSEDEQWESRPLLEVFEDEIEEKSTATAQLANRDVAASIMNLRKTLQTEDFRKIFDPRNRWIGEN